jgi:hypothetical protein
MSYASAAAEEEEARVAKLQVLIRHSWQMADGRESRFRLRHISVFQASTEEEEERL